MKDPLMGFCDYKRKGATKPADFEEKVGFVERRDIARSFIVVKEIRDDAVVLTRVTTGGEGSDELFTLTSAASEIPIKELSVRLDSITDGKAILVVTSSL
jgi:hypothetical protein